MLKLKNSKCDETKQIKLWRKKTYIVTKPKTQIGLKLKNQIVMNPKNSNSDETQKLKMWYNSKTQIVMKLKLWWN